MTRVDAEAFAKPSGTGAESRCAVHKFIAAVLITSALLIPGIAHRAQAGALAAWLPSVVDANPAPDLVVGSTYPQISARFSSLASVDPTSIRIAVDGRDVTSGATVTNAYVSYVPVTPMDSGRHTVTVVGQALDGAQFSDSWAFMVDSGMSESDTFWHFAPGPLGYPIYGFSPPGFSLFAPGPIFFVAGNFVQIVFLSPFSPYGTGFVTITGIPGQFFLTPWYGYPGYYWCHVPVPFGVVARSAILSAHFTTSEGQTVIVHSTTPLQIDGTRTTLPGSIRFANKPVFVSHPTSPQDMVQFVRVVPRAGMSVVPKNEGDRPIVPGLVEHNVGVPGKSAKPIEPVTTGGNASRRSQLAPSDPIRVLESNQHSLDALLRAAESNARHIDDVSHASSGWSGQFPVTTAPFHATSALFSPTTGPFSMPIAPFSGRGSFSLPGMPMTGVPMTGTQLQSSAAHRGAASQH